MNAPVRAVTGPALAELVLDRPDVLNALDEAAVAAFHRALDEVEAGGARALLVRGEGRAFSAGRDLRAAEPLTEDARAILADCFHPAIARLANLPLPTVAAVRGAALGVGFGIAMACDVVMAATDARLGSPFARIGCVLDSGGHHALVHRVGPHRALELIYTGRLLSGEEAETWGLVNRAVPPDELDAVARQLAGTVAEGPTAALVRSKGIVRAVVDGMAYEAALQAEAEGQGAVAGGPDYVEGITAFLEKRTPTFQGR